MKRYYWECWYCRTRGKKLHEKRDDAFRGAIRHESRYHEEY